MCLMLYLGSDKERPVSSWDKTHPRFYVENLIIAFVGEDRDAIVRKVQRHFSKRFVYYVGSHEGCGCGFRREGNNQQGKKESIKTAENQKKLYDYVAECLTDENTIELYACWAGDESNPADLERKIPVEELIRDDFFFSEDEFTVVKK